MDFNPFKKGGAAPTVDAETISADAPASSVAKATAQPIEVATPQHAPPRPARRQVRDIGYDCCGPCRKGWNAVLRGLASTKVVTGLAVALPCAYLVIVLAVTSMPAGYGQADWVVGMNMMRAYLTGPMAVVSSFTFISGLLGLFAVHQSMQKCVDCLPSLPH